MVDYSYNDSAEINTDPDDARVTKREFIKALSDRTGVPIAVTEQVYDAFLAEVTRMVRQGQTVSLHGFGRFYAQLHRGHTAQFGAEAPLDDYRVLKFSTARPLTRFMAMDDEEAARNKVPGTTVFLDVPVEDRA